MKKLILLSAAIVVFSACQAQAPAAQDQASPSPMAATDMTQVATALQTGQSVACQMTKENGAETINYKAKGEKVHNTVTTSASGDKVTEMIMDGEYLYTWTQGDTTGIKAQMPSKEDIQSMMDQFGQTMPDLSNDEGQQQFEDQGYTINCQVQAVADSEFVPPSTVQFTDASAMMKKATESVKNVGNSMSPEQQEAMKRNAQEMMQQFGAGNQ